MYSARMALWDRNKIVIMVAMGIWLTNVSFLIHGKSLLLTFGNWVSYNIPFLLLHQVPCRSVLNFDFDYLNLLGLCNCTRSAPPGHLCKAPVL